METTVTGYNYNHDKVFIGEYQIHTHPDFDVHVPPNMTLVSPLPIPEGQDAVWDGTNWSYQAKPELEKTLIEPIKSTENGT